MVNSVRSFIRRHQRKVAGAAVVAVSAASAHATDPTVGDIVTGANTTFGTVQTAVIGMAAFWVAVAIARRVKRA